MNDNASSLTADDAPDMEATEPECLRERMQKEREWERTVELLGCAASSKSQSYPVNQDTREGKYRNKVLSLRPWFEKAETDKTNYTAFCVYLCIFTPY